MNSNLFTYQQFEHIYKKKGYKFNTGSFNLNLAAIRSTLFPQPNKFDDVFAVIYTDALGYYNSLCVKCTTDPGFYYLQNPMNVKGTAIVKEGQYENVWRIGLHKGYEALVQTGVITVYRDNNKDTVLDLNPNHLDSGYFGIDMHHASFTGSSEDVGKWSAGCIVIQDITDFLRIMTTCKLQSKNLYTFTLFQESDFIS